MMTSLAAVREGRERSATSTTLELSRHLHNRHQIKPSGKHESFLNHYTPPTGSIGEKQYKHTNNQTRLAYICQISRTWVCSCNQEWTCHSSWQESNDCWCSPGSSSASSNSTWRKEDPESSRELDSRWGHSPCFLARWAPFHHHLTWIHNRTERVKTAYLTKSFAQTDGLRKTTHRPIAPRYSASEMATYPFSIDNPHAPVSNPICYFLMHNH